MCACVSVVGEGGSESSGNGFISKPSVIRRARFVCCTEGMRAGLGWGEVAAYFDCCLADELPRASRPLVFHSEC